VNPKLKARLIKIARTVTAGMNLGTLGEATESDIEDLMEFIANDSHQQGKCTQIELFYGN
jgi:hypothetical protein